MNLPVVVCIGTPSVSGDSLGPLVADILRTDYNLRAYIYGGTNTPVNGVNFDQYSTFIRERHPTNFIIAVDACVGEKKDVGKIKYSYNGISAGGALDKKLAKTGAIGVLAVVAEKNDDNLQTLMSVPFSDIEKLSVITAERTARIVNAVLCLEAEVV
ncbi:MAG: spore protease YyaC [Christensenellaceae bacterium]|nr:spore protease YyaC [Christensenellaceae bacterium]